MGPHIAAWNSPARASAASASTNGWRSATWPRRGGAKTCFVPADAGHLRWAADIFGAAPALEDIPATDPGAEVEAELAFDMGALTPLWPGRSRPTMWRRSPRSRRCRVNQVYIGNCANGTLTDLRQAPRSWAGGASPRAALHRRAGHGADLPRTPSRGAVETLVEAGAIIAPSTCGACAGRIWACSPPTRWRSHHQPHYHAAWGAPGSAGLSGERLCGGGPAVPASLIDPVQGRHDLLSGRAHLFGDDIDTTSSSRPITWPRAIPPSSQALHGGLAPELLRAGGAGRHHRGRPQFRLRSSREHAVLLRLGVRYAAVVRRAASGGSSSATLPEPGFPVIVCPARSDAARDGARRGGCRAGVGQVSGQSFGPRGCRVFLQQIWPAAHHAAGCAALRDDRAG